MGPPRATHLETPRLELRPFVRADVEPMAEILGDPVSLRFYPHPLSLEETKAWVAWNTARFEAHGLGLWAFVLRDSAEVVGDCGAVVQQVDGSEELELWKRRLGR